MELFKYFYSSMTAEYYYMSGHYLETRDSIYVAETYLAEVKVEDMR